MKILFNSYDVAHFLVQADVKVSQERKIISMIYSTVKIAEKVSEQTFVDRVRLHFLETEDYNEMISFFQGLVVPYQFQEDEEEMVLFYFKNLYLDLYFNENCSYRKIKLRSLIRMFGYKRRSEQLVNTIEKTLKQLKIKTYLRGNEGCTISSASLNDMIIFKTFK